MPVLDHPTHAAVIKPVGRKYGCHSRTGFADGFWAKDGVMVVDVLRDTPITGYKMTHIKHTMSRACRYDGMDADPSCEGCTAEKDREYLERMKC